MNYKLTLFFFLLFQLALAQTTNDAVAKGNLYYKQGEFELAERQYRHALPGEVAQYNLADALVQQKRYKEALEILNSLINATKEPVTKQAAHYNAGVVYSKLQDNAAAIEAYKNALRMNPSDKEARENLQKALQEQKKKSGGGGAAQSKSSMDQSEADQKLKQLQEREKRLQQQMQGKYKDKGGNPAQDW